MDAVVSDGGPPRLVEPDAGAVFNLPPTVMKQIVRDEMTAVDIRLLGRGVACIAWPDAICIQAKATYILNPVARDRVVFVRFLHPYCSDAGGFQDAVLHRDS